MQAARVWGCRRCDGRTSGHWFGRPHRPGYTRTRCTGQARSASLKGQHTCRGKGWARPHLEPRSGEAVLDLVALLPLEEVLGGQQLPMGGGGGGVEKGAGSGCNAAGAGRGGCAGGLHATALQHASVRPAPVACPPACLKGRGGSPCLPHACVLPSWHALLQPGFMW